MMHIGEMVMNIACMECSNLSSWDFFYIGHFLRCMTHEEKLSIFSDLEAAISAALHESFVHSKYAYRVSHVLLY